MESLRLKWIFCDRVREVPEVIQVYQETKDWEEIQWVIFFFICLLSRNRAFGAMTLSLGHNASLSEVPFWYRSEYFVQFCSSNRKKPVAFTATQRNISHIYDMILIMCLCVISGSTKESSTLGFCCVLWGFFYSLKTCMSVKLEVLNCP